MSPHLIWAAARPWFIHHGEFVFQSKKGQVLTLNGITFARPKRYALLPSDTGNVIFMYNKNLREGLFIAALSAPFNQEVITNLIKTSVGKSFPKEPQTWVWKQAGDYQKISNFETGGGKSLGFNKKHLVVAQYRHLVFEKKGILVGYVYEGSKGKQAEEEFNMDYGSGTVVMVDPITVCDDSVEIIYSITGEKIDENNPPCGLLALPLEN